MTGNRGAGTGPRGGEFELIAECFAPLSAGMAGAFGLTDDGAVFEPEAGRELVMTKDMMVAGVHFPPAGDAATIGRRLLRVNLSDLAAMGARPMYYLLGLALPRDVAPAWPRAFAEGLALDQDLFGVTLAGGDTVATDGPLVLSATLIGSVAAGGALRRVGARAGDGIYVSGTLGDAALGLIADRGDLDFLEAPDIAHLSDRLALPRPRLALGQGLAGLASAAIDVSDGLIADLRHICTVSGVGARIEAGALPLSDAARKVVAQRPELVTSVLGGGDDYELCFTAATAKAGAVAELSEGLGLGLTRIGEITAGPGISVTGADGRPLDAVQANVHEGYTHF